MTETTDVTECPVILSEDAVRLISRKGIAPKDIISQAVVDGENIPTDELSFGSSGEPELEFRREGNMFVCMVSIYSGEDLLASPTVATVLKGDVNMDGQVNSVDASIVLACYAMRSVGKDWYFTSDTEAPEDMLTERLCYLAADIDTESATMCSEQGSMIDSNDASAILACYSASSVGKAFEW